MIPIAKLIKSRKNKEKSSNENQSKILSLDEQIALLENSLESDDDSDIEDSYENIIAQKDENGNIVKFLSASNFERIQPLPKEYLPDLPPPSNIKRRKSIENNDEPKLKKKKRKKEKNDDGISNDEEKPQNGLEATYREMMRNYQPLSGEKIPFYCRICRFKGESLLEFNTHKNTSEHQLASDIELRMSYCKLCRKQFTSPAQLREHLMAKPHKEKLKFVQEKQLQANSTSSNFSR